MANKCIHEWEIVIREDIGGKEIFWLKCKKCPIKRIAKLKRIKQRDIRRLSPDEIKSMGYININ